MVLAVLLLFIHLCVGCHGSLENTYQIKTVFPSSPSFSLHAAKQQQDGDHCVQNGGGSDACRARLRMTRHMRARRLPTPRTPLSAFRPPSLSRLRPWWAHGKGHAGPETRGQRSEAAGGTEAAATGDARCRARMTAPGGYAAPVASPSGPDSILSDHDKVCHRQALLDKNDDDSDAVDESLQIVDAVLIDASVTGGGSRSFPQRCVPAAVLWGPPPSTWVPLLPDASHAGVLLGRRVRWRCCVRGHHPTSPLGWGPVAAMWGLAPVLWARLLQAGRHAGPLRGQRSMLASTPAFVTECFNLSQGDGCVHQRQQVYFLCQSAFLFICRHGSGKSAIGVQVDRQRQLK